MEGNEYSIGSEETEKKYGRKKEHPIKEKERLTPQEEEMENDLELK